MDGFNGAADLGPTIQIGVAQDAIVIGAGESVGIGADDAGAQLELFLLSIYGADLRVRREAELAELVAPGVAGIGRNIFGGKKADADGFEIARFGHFPAELGEFILGNVRGPLNGFDEAAVAHFEIDDFADAFFNGGVIVGIDERGVFGEVIKTPTGSANDFVEIIDRFVAGDVSAKAVFGIKDFDFGMNGASQGLHRGGRGGYLLAAMALEGARKRASARVVEAIKAIVITL